MWEIVKGSSKDTLKLYFNWNGKVKQS